MTVRTLATRMLTAVSAATSGDAQQQRHKCLIRVAEVRGRVLCASCNGQNDDFFRFCQFCKAPSAAVEEASDRYTKTPLDIDEQALGARVDQFHAAIAESTSEKRRDAVTDLFARFLKSRVGTGHTHMADAQPKDVLDFLCWLDSCGDRRRTVVHDRYCVGVGTDSFAECSTMEGACTLRYAAESLRTNYMSKLATAYERDLGVAPVWNEQLRTGNPVRSEVVTRYMAFIRSEQKRAGVLVKQAPVLLQTDLAAIVGPMRARLQNTRDAANRLILARNIAIFTVAFSTTKRGDELTRTLIQRILRLPNRSGFLFKFQWGKTMRDGSDHLLTVPYDDEHLATCAIRAVEQWVSLGEYHGWDMTKGYLFSSISVTATGSPVRDKRPLTAAQMTQMLKQSAAAAGVRVDCSMHSFRSGGAVSRALKGDDLSQIMQRAFWKNPATAWRYMQLAKVVSPGSSGYEMASGVTEAQFKEINEFPLSEQSRAWAAFGNAPML